MGCTRVPAGHVGVKDFFGNVSSDYLNPGINVVFPLTWTVEVPVRTVEVKEVADVPTSEGLVVHLEVSLLYHIRPDKAVELYKTVGTNYEEVVVKPQFRSVIRDTTADYEAKALYSDKRELVAQGIFKAIVALLAPRGIDIEKVLIRAIVLPPQLAASIQEKLQAEQTAQKMQFVLQREKQEAERKRIEAQGISDFQNIVAKGISEPLLKWKAIEVAAELSKSPNAKIILLGDKSGLPIILSDK